MVERCKPSTLKSFISPHVSLCALLRLFSDLSQIDVLWSRPLWTPSKELIFSPPDQLVLFYNGMFHYQGGEGETDSHTQKAKMLGHTSSLSYDQVSFHWLPFFKLGQREYWVYILLFTQGHMLFMNVCGSVSFYGCVTLILAAALL